MNCLNGMTEYQIPQSRPWLRFWPEGVPQHLAYPVVPLFQLLSRAAREWPAGVAFSCRERALSYKELDEMASRLAVGLHSLGIRPGDRVALFLPNSLEFVIGYYGILKAGATVTMANPLFKQGELKHQLNDTAAVAIITSSAQYPLVKEVQAETRLKVIVLTDTRVDSSVVCLAQLLTECSSTPPGLVINPRDDIAVITYTGGTTGLPKGVLLTHYNLVANAMQNAVWFGWTRRDTVIGVLPFYHSWGSCTCLNSAIYSGARVLVLPRFDPEELVVLVEREKPTVLYGATSMFLALLNSPTLTKGDLSSLRYVKAGAMPTAPEVKERWERLTGVRMMLGYGLSEASPETHNSPPQRVRPGTVGIPIIDTDARIVDPDTGRVNLPSGQIGELIIKGPQVMKGYFNQPSETQDTIRNGWLYTGDLGLVDEEGYFHILDRKKETIKYKGYTIAPAELEAVLYEHPAIKECAVVGKPDSLAGEVPRAYVVLKGGATVSEDELIQFCAARISAYKRIREVKFVKEIPKTPVGKVLRRVLRDREQA